LFKIPQVVCYKTSTLSYEIGRRLVSKNLEYFSLVNLIADAPMVTELLQGEYNAVRLEKELHTILDCEHRTKIFESYLELEETLGGKGASDNVAKIIMEKLS